MTWDMIFVSGGRLVGKVPWPGPPLQHTWEPPASRRHSPLSALYCLPCALQGAGASLGHLSVGTGCLVVVKTSMEELPHRKVRWVTVNYDKRSHIPICILSICVAHLLRADCEVPRSTSGDLNGFWNETLGWGWAAGWGLKWPRPVLVLARKETMRIV